MSPYNKATTGQSTIRKPELAKSEKQFFCITLTATLPKEFEHHSLGADLWNVMAEFRGKLFDYGSVKRDAFLPAGQNDCEGMEPAHNQTTFP
jgi:hypothetical protein